MEERLIDCWLSLPECGVCRREKGGNTLRINYEEVWHICGECLKGVEFYLTAGRAVSRERNQGVTGSN